MIFRKTIRKLLSVFLIILALTACAPARPTEIPTATPGVEPIETPLPGSEPAAGHALPEKWWNETVFYEIFVRSFRDSDGDGIGDFDGITEKLGYLQALGITGLWLMPINPSSSYHGYDVTDYFAVNPDYGAMDDFKNLLEQAHEYDIKIIIDFVLNHTSARHPWFQAAQTPGSEYHNYYVWRDSDPGALGPWGAQAWYRASNGLYYYAIFWDQMPDLNYNNPKVREEVKQITAFWLEDVGVDGFRLDAARYLVEDQKSADSDSNHSFLAEWGAYYRSLNPRAFTVGEAWTDNANVKPYVSTDTELDAAFNFDLSNAILDALNTSNNALLRFVLQTTIRDFPGQENANFITNHDMPRVMNQLGNNKESKAKAAAAILLTAPGIPFIYYGEEIGMSGTKPDELIRTPMQWSSDPGAGFSSGIPWEPVNDDSLIVNVNAQAGDPTSLLNHYRTLIQLRNAHPALRNGKTYVAGSNSKKLVAYLRASGDDILLTLVNLDDEPVDKYTLNVSVGPLSGDYQVVSLLDDSAVAQVTANDKGGFDDYAPLPEIPAYGVFVLQLKP